MSKTKKLWGMMCLIFCTLCLIGFLILKYNGLVGGNIPAANKVLESIALTAKMLTSFI